MKAGWTKYLVTGTLLALLAGCSSKPTDRGQQYKDGKLIQPLALVNQPNAKGRPVNGKDFADQVAQIRFASAGLYSRQSVTYSAVQSWLMAGGDTRQLRQFGLNAFQMEGTDNYGNVQFTGYYTPVVQARYSRQGEFQYPLYRMPNKKRSRLPSRAEIYSGALGEGYVAGYSNSLMDNFIMDVQGSGYVDFGDGRPLKFFGYGGKNGHPYRSVGKVLIDRGEVKQEDMSMQAIRQWGEQHSEAEVRELLEQNPSFVFFKPEDFVPVRGASAVPLIAKASVAADRALIPAGTALLAEIPLLNNNGKFTGKYEMRMMVSLDVGGAIKGQHFDIYQGVGREAGHMAGWFNHYGRVWVLKTAPGTGAPVFSSAQNSTSQGSLLLSQ
ncbi:murein transglycosylase A [Erwinia amylovora]|uniref:Membrane-bound lytic murein transglycosylase A n=3 Tax=Erwinia amylovora TaxID=552 RepID=A0A831ESB7_ERWAM|nr:murein transglycosylase A [Erwinia amylovora]CDK14301.1 membrane-bound lytic murein transglycosylase A [Erwinia amylovora LA635]CDK17668.1 membrane-bound lytic murein transglycosylase A [Erwinia amylovora LA636]CDK21037.1 membrane-bound lytic murein transglycosylase A [Erwinia amylovora LA637]ATZ12486.1 murein transglycosylase A [Erwinia amylovora]EKV54998.1 membrane-bound lytic murein transglycosylase A [Erwinia amylovora ACW56400]